MPTAQRARASGMSRDGSVSHRDLSPSNIPHGCRRPTAGTAKTCGLRTGATFDQASAGRYQPQLLAANWSPQAIISARLPCQHRAQFSPPLCSSVADWKDPARVPARQGPWVVVLQELAILIRHSRPGLS